MSIAMTKIEQIKDLLYKVQRTYAHEQAEYIRELQNKIWDETNDLNDDLQEILSDLAYNLNFYERDERYRDEDLGYYGDDKLSRIVDEAINKIETLKIE
jgi:hypothetical protein